MEGGRGQRLVWRGAVAAVDPKTEAGAACLGCGNLARGGRRNKVGEEGRREAG